MVPLARQKATGCCRLSRPLAPCTPAGAIALLPGGRRIAGLCRRLRPAPAAGGLRPLHPRWGHFISPDPLKCRSVGVPSLYLSCLFSLQRRDVCCEVLGMNWEIVIHARNDHCKGVWGKGPGPQRDCRGRRRPAAGVRGCATPRLAR
jgi:hypothetical protein